MHIANLVQLMLRRLTRRRATRLRRQTTRIPVRIAGTESLETRRLLSAPTLTHFLTTEHVDLDISYNASGQTFEMRCKDSDNGVTHETADALIYVGTQALTSRPAGSGFDFLGVSAGQPLYVLPASQDVALPYLGFASYSTTSVDIDPYLVTTESKGRRVGIARFLKLTLLDVAHFQPDGNPGTGHFSAWQSGISGPVVYMSTFDDNVANANTSGFDATDGISADDALWITRGGHDHHNLGFTQTGRYEVSFRVSAYIGNNGNSTTPNLAGYRESGTLKAYFSVLNLGQIEFDSSTYSVNEGGQSATVTVRRIHGSDGQLTVDLSTSDGTALADNDYSPVSQTLTFLDKQLTQVVTVPIIDDTLAEADETVLLTLSNPGPLNIADYVASPAYDNGSLLGPTQTATLTILDNPGNSSPTDMTLAPGAIAENRPVGTTVGNFTTSDPDPGDSFTYALVSGTGGSDNDHFEILANQLRTRSSFNFEAKSGYSIRVRATDSGNLAIEKVFSIAITDVNESPSALTLSATSIAENQPAGTTVGSFSTTDPDAGDSFTYSLVTGTGDSGNSAFEIVDNQLRTTAEFNHESQASYSIRVRATDSGNLAVEKVFSIAITDVNESPSALTLSATSIAENQPAGTTVGSFSTTDPDAGDSFTYSLVTGTGDSGNSAFEIVDNQLRTTAAFNYESQASYSIRVRSTDSGNLTNERVFAVTVDDLNEAPTQIILSSNSISENAAVGTTIGFLSSTDPDGDSSFSYALVTGPGDAGNAAFQIVNNEVRSRIIFNHDLQTTYSLRIQSTDPGQASCEQTLSILILPYSLPPVISATAGILTYTENASPMSILPGSTVTDADSSNFAGGILTVRFASGADSADRLRIRNAGTGAGQIGITGQTVTFGGVAIGETSGGVTDHSDLVVTLNASANATAITALVRAVTFSTETDNPTVSARVVRYSLTDGDGGTSVDRDREVRVTPVNDAPTLVTGSAGAEYEENAPPVVIAPELVIFDVDSPDFDMGKLTISIASGSVATDRLTILAGEDASGEIGVDGQDVLFDGIRIGSHTGGYTSNGPLTITFNSQATPAIAGAVARRIGFHNAGHNPTASTRSVSFALTDGDRGTAVTTSTQITVIPVNDPALISPTTGILVYKENAAPATIFTASAVTDPDSLNFDEGVLTVGFQAGAQPTDRLRIRHVGSAPGQIGVDGQSVTFGGVLIGEFSGGHGDTSDLVIRLTGNATAATTTALLKAITFSTDTDDPVATARTVRAVLTDGDGGVSESTARQVQVSPLNDAPIVSAGSGDAAYEENAAPTLVAPGIVITDVDSPDLDTGKLTVRIASGVVATDRLTLLEEESGSGGVRVDGNAVLFGDTVVGTLSGGYSTSGPLTITFNTASTPAIAQAVARRVAFHNAGDNPTMVARTISFALTDGDRGTAVPTSRQVTVSPVNDPSVITATSGSLTYTENAPPAPIFTSSTVTDPDSPNFEGGVLTVGFHAGVQPADRLRIRHAGTAAGQIGVEGQAVTFGGVLIGGFSGGYSDTSDLVISLNGNATPAATTALLKAITFSTDTDNPVAAPRTVRTWVTDGDGGTSAAIDRELRVTPVNDAPTIAAGLGQTGYGENAPAVLIAPELLIADVDSTDFDTGKLTVTISAGGVATDRLTISPQGREPGEVAVEGTNVLFGGLIVGTLSGGYTGSGPLSVLFNAEATPEIAQAVARRVAFHNVGDNPTASIRTVTFSLTDGDRGTATPSTRQIVVTPENDSPAITMAGADVSWKEGAAATLLAPAAVVADPDGSSLGGGTLVVSLTEGLTANDQLAIRHQGTGTGQVGISGADVLLGDKKIATFSGGTTGAELVVTFEANATVAGVQAVLRNITFRVEGLISANSSRRVRFVLTDGAGGTSPAVEKGISVINV